MLLDVFVFDQTGDATYDDYVTNGVISSSGKVATKNLTTLINVVVVLIVVSIPDGLPITIGISLAFSVMTMFKQKILVRKLEAPETMGGL
jgi:Ca2+-transporting ATPase